MSTSPKQHHHHHHHNNSFLNTEPPPERVMAFANDALRVGTYGFGIKIYIYYTFFYFKIRKKKPTHPTHRIQPTTTPAHPHTHPQYNRSARSWSVWPTRASPWRGACVVF